MLTPISRRAILPACMLPVLFYSLTSPRAQEKTFSDMKDFREHVMKILAAKPGVSAVTRDQNDPAVLSLAHGDKTFTIDLTNLYRRLDAYPGEDVDAAIDQFLSQLDPSPGRTVSEENLVVVLRARAYVELLNQKGVTIRHQPLTGDLHAVYMVDLPDSMSPLLEGEMASRSNDELAAIAKRNVSRWLPKIVTAEEIPGAVGYTVDGNTFLASSLVLLDEFWNSVDPKLARNALVVVASYDQLFLIDATNEQAESIARRLIEFTFQDGFNLLSDQLYQRRNGQIELYRQ